MGYPDTEGYAYSFASGELTLGASIYTAIGGVDIDQPTEEGAVMGTRSFPLKRTVGEMGLGAGTVNFTDEAERSRFIDNLGNAWREKTWTLKWKRRAVGAPDRIIVAYGCRCLSEPVQDKQGSDALGGDITFSFMYHTVNGKVPHSGLPAPTLV